jgi:aminoglycoside phosphotransferase (APT) family kinase protein
VWVHGDLAPGNLLVAGGTLCGVIDFGQLAVGDPACDATLAWTRFSGASRAAFRAALAFDEGVWARARGWALWKGLLTLREAHGAAAAHALRVVADVIAESRSESLRAGR